MKNNKKHTSGITLIALVVTIIVLLILAGISIAMLSGDNSILSKATDAKTNTDNSQIQERINLAYHSSLVDGQGKVTETSLENELKKEFNKTTLGEEWLDKTSVEGKWKITIDDVSLEVPAGTGTISPPSSPLDVLIGKQKKDIMFKYEIPIDDTSNAKFYDCDFNSSAEDDYIEYKGVIYKVSYNEYNYDHLSTVVSVSKTDIDVSLLGKNDNNITTLLYETHECWWSPDSDYVRSGITSYFIEVENAIRGETCIFPYDSNGILTGYPMWGDYDYDFSEHGYSEYRGRIGEN